MPAATPRVRPGVAALAGRARRWVATDRASATVHALTLVAGLPVLMVICRGEWFFGDEWDFVLDRGLNHPLLGLLTPHNEHWSLLPILEWRFINLFAGLRAYWPYLLAVEIVHLVTVHLVWRVARRMGVRSWVATGVALSAIVLGVGYENLTWAFQITFDGSIMWGFAAMLVSDRLRPGWRVDGRLVASWALLLASLSSSGVGDTLTFAVVLALLLRRGWVTAFKVGVVPVVIFLAWYAEYGRDAVQADGYGVTAQNVVGIPAYVANGISAALDGWSGFANVGGVLFIVLLFVAGTSARRREGGFATALLAAVVVFFLFAAVGRVALGTAEAAASRYSYNVVMLMLPVIMLGFQRLQQRGGYVVPLGLSVLLVGVGWAALVDHHRSRVALVEPTKEQTLAQVALILRGETVLSDPGLPLGDGRDTPSRLARAAGSEHLSTDGVTPQQLADARLTLETSVAAAPSPGDATAAVAGWLHATAGAQHGDCRTFTPDGNAPQIGFFTAGQTIAVSLTLAAPETLSVSVNPRVAADGPGSTAQKSFPAGTSWLRVSATDSTVRLELPPGATRFCGLSG